MQAIRFNAQSTVSFYTHPNGFEANVQWDPLDGVLGDGCLKIDAPPTETTCAAEWRAPLSAAWTTDYQGFNPGEWYMQLRVKLGPYRNTPSVNGGGYKIFNLAEYRISNPSSSFSNTSNEVVVNNQNWRGSLFVYRNPGYQGLDEVIGGNIRLQPARDLGAGVTPDTSRYCIYPGSAGCWEWPLNEWFTILLRLKAPNEGGSTGNELDIWVAREGESTYSQLFASRDFFYGPDLDVCPLGVNGIHLLAYDTGRSSASYWTNHKYDQLIVSRAWIPPPAVVPLPSWVPAVGVWTEIAGTALSSVDPNPTPPGVEGPSAKVNDWTSFVVNPRDSTVWCACNGGHDGYSGNEVDRLTLFTETPYWTNVLPPSSTVSDTNYYPDGRPASVHTYYGVTYDHINNRVLLIGGSRYSSGALHNHVNSYNITNNAYSAAGTHPDISAAVASQEQRLVGVDARNGCVYTWAWWNVGKFNPATNTWTTPISDASGIYGQKTAVAFDTLRHRFLMLGDGLHHTYDPDANAFTSRTITGTDISAVGAMGMVYIPELDAFLARQSGSGGTVYRIDANTFNCTTFSNSGGSSIPSTQNGPYNKFLYVPKLKGCVYVPTHGGNAWFLRTH